MDLTCKVAYDIMSFINVKNGINVPNTYIQRKTYPRNTTKKIYGIFKIDKKTQRRQKSHR